MEPRQKKKKKKKHLKQTLKVHLRFSPGLENSVIAIIKSLSSKRSHYNRFLIRQVLSVP